MKKDISSEAQHLIKSLINPDPNKRIGVNKTLKHPWLSNADIVNLPN